MPPRLHARHRMIPGALTPALQRNLNTHLSSPAIEPSTPRLRRTERPPADEACRIVARNRLPVNVSHNRFLRKRPTRRWIVRTTRLRSSPAPPRSTIPSSGPRPRDQDEADPQHHLSEGRGERAGRGARKPPAARRRTGPRSLGSLGPHTSPSAPASTANRHRLRTSDNRIRLAATPRRTRPRAPNRHPPPSVTVQI